MKYFIIIPIFFLFISCATHFFIKESIIIDKDRDRKDLSQTIIVSNPPRDQNELYNIIENYNRQTISYIEIMEYNIDRDFYRETMFLTRKYEKGKPYPTMLGEFIYGQKQSIVNHPDAHLLWTANLTDISGQHYFIIFKNAKIVFERKIDNPEKYYLKE
jgi:hypothetical protein